MTAVRRSKTRNLLSLHFSAGIMNGLLSGSLQLFTAILLLLPFWSTAAAQNNPAAPGSAVREPWTTSRLRGSPERPLPLETVPAFPKLKFEDPMHVRWQPDLQRYFVCELHGKVFSFSHDEQTAVADLAVDFKTELRSFDPTESNGVQDVYSIVFDPDFKSNRFIYVMMVLSSKTGEPLPNGSRVSRFTVTEDSPPRIDVNSELPLISWLAGGHNGCDLAFDNSGCLLISTGDATAPSPPDGLQTGQNLTDLLSCILRIDVRGAAAGQPYRIPADNPFVEHSNAKPEIWAIGFRNPWRISVDKPSGRVFVGDVGWEKWELVHEVQAGGNYGWSVFEGPERIQPNLAEGPGPVRSPRAALPHSEAASITGGFVFHSAQVPELRNRYLFGDWVSGRIWSLSLADSAAPRLEAVSPLRIIAFAPDRDGLPLVVNHLSPTTLFRLQPIPDRAAQQAAAATFPRKLSETGLFADTAAHQWNTGVREFRIQHPTWHDGAVARRAIALPGRSQAAVYSSPKPLEQIAMFNSRLHYPPGTVFAKTLELDGHRIETQVLQFDGRLWQAFTWVWNADQTDAELAPANGLEIPLPGHPGRSWRIHSRTECFQCHNLWAETSLAFTPEQLHDPGDGGNSEWLRLVEEGFVTPLNHDGTPAAAEACVRQPLTSNSEAPIAQRARSWLHANCAHCHQQNAGTGAALTMRSHDSDADTGLFDTLPAKGGFGLTDAKIISRGKPQQSALLYRVASASAGRMPHIGSREVDFAGVKLLTEWVAGMHSGAVEPMWPNQPETAALAAEAEVILRELAANPKQSQADAALRLALQVAGLSGSERALLQEPLRKLAGSEDTLISSLFEACMSPELRQRRLSPQAVYADVAGLTGNSERGKALFLNAANLQCAKCHQPDPSGRRIGPNLQGIGLRSSPEQLFESIANPERKIEAKYQTRILQTTNGQTLIGVTESETGSELILVTATGERLTVAKSEIESASVDSKSIMPSSLGTQLTAQQMADLLAWLSEQKEM
jgi:putative heme-binding domain-containing protein